MNERTHFFIYISQTLFSKGLMLVGCERWVGERDRLLHIDLSSSDHSSSSFSSWLGLLNRGSLRAQIPLSAAVSHFGILSPINSNSNWLKPSVSWLYFYFTPTCSSAYLHRCISWLTARSKVNMLHQFNCKLSITLDYSFEYLLLL